MLADLFKSYGLAVDVNLVRADCVQIHDFFSFKLKEFS